MTGRTRKPTIAAMIGLVLLLLLIGLPQGLRRTSRTTTSAHGDSRRSDIVRYDGAHHSDTLILDAGNNPASQQSPRTNSIHGGVSVEKKPSSDMSAESIETMKADSIGEKNYSKYDTDESFWRIKVEQVGIPQPEPTTFLSFEPSTKDRQRMRQIDREREDAIAKGLIKEEPRDGYVRREFDDGQDVIYVKEGFAVRFDELAREYHQINERGMTPVPGTAYPISRGLRQRFPDGTVLEYYRRYPDGSLIRSVTPPNGVAKTWVIGPPPDFASYPDYLIRIMRDTWR